MVSISKIYNRLFTPVDAASIVFFRLIFGMILLYESFFFLSNNYIYWSYLEPQFLFKYYGFGWIQLWTGGGMYVCWTLLGVLAFFIIIGFCYRLSVFLYLLGFTYIFLVDQAIYLNHFYLVIIYLVIMCVVPAHRYLSVDSKIWPKTHSTTLPFWAIFLICAQLEIVLIHAGLVKINIDWIMRMQPLSTWLGRNADMPILGPLFTQVWAVAVANYGVILLHLVGAPLLIFRQTRIWIFLMYVIFHISNHFVFNIGIFPWFTLLATSLFFSPSWPRTLISKISHSKIVDPSFNSASIPNHSTDLHAYQWNALNNRQRLILLFISVWLTFQILIPLRHWIYPGDVAWTHEGHRFAWRMRLSIKRCESLFLVSDPTTGKSWIVDPFENEYFSDSRARKMSGQPDMILQFAHILASEWEKKHDLIEVEVRAKAFCSLNGLPSEYLIDSDVNLAKVERNLWSADWILPLQR